MPYPSISRRAVFQAMLTLSAGIAAGHAGRAIARDKKPSRAITKPIPSTGERLPVIGLGTNQFGVQAPEELARIQQVLETMAQNGGRVIDTARAYGRSEEVIGQLVERMGNRKHFFLSTKTPMGQLRSPGVEIQDAFDRLRVDMIDLLLVHNLNGLDQFMPFFIEEKKKGRIRYIGVSTSTDNQYAGLMDAMKRYPLDIIQVDYSIENRGAAAEVLPLAQQSRMGVLVNVPFGGRRGAAATFGRVQGRPLPDFAAEFDVASWAQFLLKYVVSHPAVTAAIPGTTRPAHIIDNQGAGRGRLPDAAMRRKMEDYWDGLRS